MYMNLNSTNQVTAGTVVLEEGMADGCLYMLLKGKVMIANRGVGVAAGAGSVIGMEQMNEEMPGFTSKVTENSSIYAVSADGDTGLTALLSANKDYSGIAVYNHVRLLTELYRQHQKLMDCSEKLYKSLKGGYDAFLSLATQYKCKAGMLPEVSSVERFTSDVEKMPSLQALLEYSKIPYEAVKTFFGFSPKLAIDEMKRFAECEIDLSEACEEASDYIEKVYMMLVGNEENCLFRNLLGLAIDMKKNGGDTAPIDGMLKDCRGFVDTVKALIGTQTTRDWRDNAPAIDEMLNAYKSGKDFREGEEEDNTAVDSSVAATVAQLTNSYRQIVEFASYNEERAQQFEDLLTEFMELPDKESTEENVRKLRRSMTDYFYGLYYLAAVEAMQFPKLPKAVELFLDYGFISEKLITPEQLAGILSLKKTRLDKPSRVYSMTEWLRAIYNGEKEPSKNDMGLDFAEYLREQKKSGEIDDMQERMFLETPAKRIEYEIRNVMLHSARVVSGQLSVFVPFLYSGQLSSDLNKAYVSTEKINFAVEDLTAIDFSIFYRETLFVDEFAGIDREYEMKNVYPVFVQYPNVGENIIMWQEITGRKRDTEGRFFAPVLCYLNLKDIMIRAFGNFRWSLCKTVQGVNWNNIQVRSLTAEYSDYIQYYRKNHDLSEERKEKVKLQIQRGRNNLRQIFTYDYEVWIKAESTGSVRLNKVVREMLATYCPFSKSITNGLIKQPIFEEAFARCIRERAKKAHDLSLRFKALEAKNVEVPPELLRTLDFYKNM